MIAFEKSMFVATTVVILLELGILLNDKNHIYRIKMWVRKRKMEKKKQMVQMYLYYILCSGLIRLK